MHVTATAKILRVLNSWHSNRIAEDARPTDHGVPNRLEGRERECAIYVDLHVRRIALAEQIEVVDDAADMPLVWETIASLTKPYVTRTFSSNNVESYWKWDIQPH